MLKYLRERSGLGLLLVALALAGCGGDPSNSFTNSVYIQIKAGGTLQPQAIGTLNGYRVVFLNQDSVPHTINWDAPLNLSATAQPNDRAWFDLPLLPIGTVLHFHLDSSGMSGTVTVAQSFLGQEAPAAANRPGTAEQASR